MITATFVEDTAEETKYEVKFTTEGNGTVTASPERLPRAIR